MFVHKKELQVSYIKLHSWIHPPWA